MLNIPFAIANTAVLVSSSFTCQMGVFAAERGQVGRTGSVLNIGGWGLREWYYLTFGLGAFFISGQTFEYATLLPRGPDASRRTPTARSSSWPPASTACT